MAGEEEEEESDGVPTMEEVLTQLNLENLMETFSKEEIDFDSLVSGCGQVGVACYLTVVHS